MSNESIVARLTGMVDDLEAGRLGLEGFSGGFLSHVEALERVPYAQLKQAQLAQAQVEAAFAQGKGDWVDVDALVVWFRSWLASVPID